MKVNTEFHTRDNVRIRVFDKEGKPVKLFQPYNKFCAALSRFFGIKLGSMVYELSGANLITNAGLVAMGAATFDSSDSTKFTYIAVGSGSTAADPTDTALGTELSGNGMSRASGSYSSSTTTVANDTKSISHTFTASGASATIAETGVFSAASAGTMINRYVLPSAITISDGSSIQITHEFQVARVSQ